MSWGAEGKTVEGGTAQTMSEPMKQVAMGVAQSISGSMLMMLHCSRERDLRQ